MNRLHNIDKPTNIIKKFDWVLITASWLATHIVLFSLYGVNQREESLTHISFAENLVNGTVTFDLHRIWYCGYTALLILIRSLGLPYASMYVLQLCLSFISLIYFIRIVGMWTSSRSAIVLSGLMYGTCFIIQQWTNYLFTDAVFCFLLVIAVYYLLQQDKSVRHRIIFWSLLIILPFFRPVGFLFIAVACLHWIFTSPGKNKIKIAVGACYLAIMLLLAYQSIVIRSGYYLPLNNLNAEIICGRPGDLLKYQVVPYTTNTTLAEYFWNNPGMTLRLFLYRFYKTFSMTRSYFSAVHNFTITAVNIIYYSLASIGIIQIIAKRIDHRYFLIAGVLIFCIPSVIFCVEWHGRMSIPMMCFTLLLASTGIERVLMLTMQVRKKKQ